MNLHLPTHPHACALQAGKQNLKQYLFLTLEWLTLRIISTAPLIYALITKQFFGVATDHVPAVALLSCLPLWILLVLPFRYRLGGQLATWFSAEGPSTDTGHYGSWLKQSLLRLIKILPFLLPLFAYLVALYYYYFFVGFNSFLMVIEGSGKLFGGDFLVGVIVIILLMLFLLLLAFYGWRRMMLFFYVQEAPVKLDGKRRKHLKQDCLTKTTFYNFFIVLPPLAISFVLLGLSLSTRLTGSTMFDLVIVVSALTQFDFPQEVLIQVGAVLAILYLPFVIYRKAALSACIHSCGKIS